jgi:DNA invertase Pin-like site-specific DNA recombinase
MDQEILDLKAEGKSLREISKAVGISHVAVGKRLKKLLTPKTPPIDMGLSVNSSDGPRETPVTGIDDLAQTIIEFLEEKGLEVYSMRTESEAYQVKHNGQIIRFYVQRPSKGDATNEEKEKV